MQTLRIWFRKLSAGGRKESTQAGVVKTSRISERKRRSEDSLVCSEGKENPGYVQTLQEIWTVVSGNFSLRSRTRRNRKQAASHLSANAVESKLSTQQDYVTLRVKLEYRSAGATNDQARGNCSGSVTQVSNVCHARGQDSRTREFYGEDINTFSSKGANGPKSHINDASEASNVISVISKSFCSGAGLQSDLFTREALMPQVIYGRSNLARTSK